jgi:hypothetical protein
MSAKSDETQLAVCRGPKPTPCDHLPSAPAETVASSERLDRPKPFEKSSIDWVKLQSNAEASNLHVTAAPGC